MPAEQAQAQQAFNRQWAQQLQHARLGAVLPLPVRLLSAELLEAPTITAAPRVVLPLSSRDANSGLQPQVAERVPAEPPLPLRFALHPRYVLARPRSNRRSRASAQFRTRDALPDNRGKASRFLRLTHGGRSVRFTNSSRRGAEYVNPPPMTDPGQAGVHGCLCWVA